MRPINLDEEKIEETHVDLRQEDAHKRLNIHTFMAHENEVAIGGTDENGEELCVWFDAYEFVQWIDIDHIKEKLTKHINKI
tara:strand:+ start:283 stop:525 length:243 start_codon:yes stop_codon:yes gene_type:complete